MESSYEVKTITQILFLGEEGSKLGGTLLTLRFGDGQKLWCHRFVADEFMSSSLAPLKTRRVEMAVARRDILRHGPTRPEPKASPCLVLDSALIRL
ncbi:hypothetical protein TNCV_5010281 [Trichonephila clavipes]|nr:hypothetical protein TNCV_5010281 [Trichonephila clavipes]